MVNGRSSVNDLEAIGRQFLEQAALLTPIHQPQLASALVRVYERGNPGVALVAGFAVGNVRAPICEAASPSVVGPSIVRLGTAVGEAEHVAKRSCKTSSAIRARQCTALQW